MSDQLSLAEQQLLGFKHAQSCGSLISLIEGMGLDATEWDELKFKYDLDYLTDDDKKEIDEYFEA